MQHTMKNIYMSSEASGLPLSGAIEVDGTLYISGQIHINEETGELLGSTIEEKTHATMKNIEVLLHQAGYTFADVVQTHIYLPDLGNASKVNEVYASYFSHPMPTRAMLGVAALPLGADIEITAIARK